VHFVGNVLNHTAAREKAFVLGRWRSIPEAPTLSAARKALAEAVESLGRRTPKAAALLDACGEEILAVYQLPEAHRKRMRSTNMLERVNQEIKRRTRVIRIFANEQACVRLVSTLHDGTEPGVDGAHLSQHGGESRYCHRRARQSGGLIHCLRSGLRPPLRQRINKEAY
jgi:transposase-like protein